MRRSRALLAISLVYAILGVATVASAGETFLSLRGETGDFVVGPKRLLFTPDGNTFNVQSNFHNGVSIVFQTPSLDQFWSLDFAAPNGQRLTRGAYEGATRFPFEASSEPGLWLAGDGVGCNTITGRFQVQQAAYASDGTVLVFAATFEQHCDGAQAAAFGEIRFNASSIT